jgi:hypothetical protein
MFTFCFNSSSSTVSKFAPQFGSPSSMAFPPSKRSKTALAEKYGHPIGPEHAVIQGYVLLKSGLTPLNPGPFLTIEERDLYHKIASYQRSRLRGEEIKNLIILWQTNDSRLYCCRVTDG